MSEPREIKENERKSIIAEHYSPVLDYLFISLRTQEKELLACTVLFVTVIVLDVLENKCILSGNFVNCDVYVSILLSVTTGVILIKIVEKISEIFDKLDGIEMIENAIESGSDVLGLVRSLENSWRNTQK